MDVKKGYKRTEVGILPEDWDVVSASEACTKIQDGTHFSPQGNGSDYLYITSKNVRFGYLDISTASRIDVAQHQAIYRRCDVRKGDLLLTKDGANTGNAALNSLDEEFSLLSSVAFLRFDERRHCAAYYLQQVLTLQNQRQIQDAMAGNAITRLTLDKIKKLRFPTTVKAEQEAIAEALTDADALIEALEQLIAKKRNIKQGAMQELLTGKRRLPGFSGEWEVKRLGEITRLLNGFAFKSSTYSQLGEFKIVTIANVQDGYMDMTECSCTMTIPHELQLHQRLQSGDILISMTGNVGRVCRVTEDNCLLNQRVGKLVATSVDDSFLVFLISQRSFLTAMGAKAKGGAQGNLSVSDISEYQFMVPTSQSEQLGIATVLSDMDGEIVALESKLTKARQIKQGMMQELLTGRIRLV